MGLLLEVTERRWLEALVGSRLQLYRIESPENGRVALEEVTSRQQVHGSNRIRRWSLWKPGDLVGTRVVALGGRDASGRPVCAGSSASRPAPPNGDSSSWWKRPRRTPAAAAARSSASPKSLATAWLRSFLPDGSTRGPQAVVDGGAEPPSTRRVLEVARSPATERGTSAAAPERRPALVYRLTVYAQSAFFGLASLVPNGFAAAQQDGRDEIVTGPVAIRNYELVAPRAMSGSGISTRRLRSASRLILRER